MDDRSNPQMNERTNQPKTVEEWAHEYAGTVDPSALAAWQAATAAAQAEIAGLRQDCWKLGFDEGVEAGKSADRQTEQQRDALMRDLQTTIVTHAAALRAKDEEIDLLTLTVKVISTGIYGENAAQYASGTLAWQAEKEKT